MPAVSVWQKFFNPSVILQSLGLDKTCRHVVEFGCGYGTFTIPAAKVICGNLTALELDPAMITYTQKQAAQEALNNVFYKEIDFCSATTEMGKRCADFVMLFNILHGEDPGQLLAEAHELLVPGGTCAIIHWNHDPDTPRGPPMKIRPKPQTLAALSVEAGFSTSPMIDLPPYHYGYRLLKPSA